MNEKQVKRTEFMIAFEKKSSLIMMSATAMKVTFMKKHPEASVLILKLASPLSMHNAARVKHFIQNKHDIVSIISSIPGNFVFN